RTCSSTNSDHGAWGRPTIMDTELSVCRHTIGHVRCGATEVSVGRQQPAAGTHRGPSKPTITRKIKGPERWEPVPPSESSWRHIASQGVPSASDHAEI